MKSVVASRWTRSTDQWTLEIQHTFHSFPLRLAQSRLLCPRLVISGHPLSAVGHRRARVRCHFCLPSRLALSPPKLLHRFGTTLFNNVCSSPFFLTKSLCYLHGLLLLLNCPRPRELADCDSIVALISLSPPYAGNPCPLGPLSLPPPLRTRTWTSRLLHALSRPTSPSPGSLRLE